MKKTKGTRIEVRGTAISILSQKDEDYICLTDFARYKNPDHTDDLIRNWLRNRNTVELLGIWEQLNNPSFNPVEFDGIKNQRDHATIEQLLVLANLEDMNAEFIYMKLPQGDRLKRLNQIAIRQMQTLTASPAIRQLGRTPEEQP